MIASGKATCLDYQPAGIIDLAVIAHRMQQPDIDDHEPGGVSLSLVHEYRTAVFDSGPPPAAPSHEDIASPRRSEDSFSEGGVDLPFITTTNDAPNLNAEHQLVEAVSSTMEDLAITTYDSYDGENMDRESNVLPPQDEVLTDDLTEHDFDQALEELVRTTNRASRAIAREAQPDHITQTEGSLTVHRDNPSESREDQPESRSPPIMLDQPSSEASYDPSEQRPDPVTNTENIDSVIFGGERIDYSVLDFLHDWEWQSQMSQVGHVNLMSHRVQSWGSSSNMFEADTLRSRRDMQGLEWSALETTRRVARQSRNTLYRHRTLFNTERKNNTDLKTACYYRFKQTNISHRPRMMHWQLRNIVAATNRNSIFYAAKDKIIRTSLTCPDMIDTVMDLSKNSGDVHRLHTEYRITTIGSTPSPSFPEYQSDSVLVAGGYSGEYTLLNLNDTYEPKPVEGFVSQAADAINTHIHTLPHRRTGALGAAFCSNDCSLRILDVTTNAFTHTHSYPYELNCAATSPDGRLRVLVGDMNQTLITDAENGAILLELSTHTDHAFACAWSPDSRHVVTGAQDGRVVVYDTRNWSTPLKTLSCELGCARSLHFTSLSEAGEPGLVVAESDDYVSIYDVKSWDRKQSIDFFGAVTGVSVLDGGQEVVVGNGDKECGGLMVFERVKERACVELWSETMSTEPNHEIDLFGGSGGRRGKKKGKVRKSAVFRPEPDDFMMDVKKKPARTVTRLEELYI